MMFMCARSNYGPSIIIFYRKEAMVLRLRFANEKWRRAGTINIILISICEVVVLTHFIISISRPGASLYRSTILFDGPCDKASRIDAILHLVVNVLSTAILASSNFFMQVVSSPSRLEVDKAHATLRSLDIGVQ